MSSPILITGVAGFIGFHTALKYLQDGVAVVGLDNLNEYDDFSFHKIDISNLDVLKNLWQTEGGFVRVIHLAAQAGVRYSLENPHAYVNSNLVGHLNILEMCRYTDDFEHLVYASSSSVYGGNTDLPYSTEQKVDSPVSLYAATKRSDELMSHSYSHLYKIPQTGLRFFTVYGPWGRPDMSYFLFTKAISERKPINVFNNGDMRRDFTYIDDIVSGIVESLRTPPSGPTPCDILNLGNNRSEKLMDFIEVIEESLGVKAEKHFMPMQPGDVQETYADISHTQSTIKYTPKTSIQEGLPKFIQWYKDYYN